MTKRLYHHDQYQHTFSSIVVGPIEVGGKPGIILEQTAFYPTSGGQPHDTGTLNDIAVIDVIEDEHHQILHLLEAPLKEFSVNGKLDWKRRFDHMQQHTGQHLLSQAFIKICDAETLSFHLGAESSTIDVNQTGFDIPILRSVENFANQVIYENREVIAHVVRNDQVDQFPIRKVPTVDDNIRIIEIKELDYSPCGGTHCAHTGEIGMLKIKRFENYKGGSRIHFVCGWRALRDYQQKTEIVKQLCEALSSGETELLQHLEKLREEAKTLRREYNYLTNQILEYEAKALMGERESGGDFYLLKKVFDDRNPKELKLLAAKILEHSANTVILFGAKSNAKASLLFLRSEELSFDMGHLMQSACEIINGRGGGQPHQAQGGGTEVEKLEEALHHIQNTLF